MHDILLLRLRLRLLRLLLLLLLLGKSIKSIRRSTLMLWMWRVSIGANVPLWHTWLLHCSTIRHRHRARWERLDVR
jgi:hypothetical protein